MELSSSPRPPAASSPPMCGAPPTSSSSSARRNWSPARRRPVSGSSSTVSPSRMHGRTPPTARTARSERFSRSTRRTPAASTSSWSDSPLASDDRHAKTRRPRGQTKSTVGRSSMRTDQREDLEAILRQSDFPVGSDVNEQRRLLRELLSAQPLPADVTVTAAALDGVPTAEITVGGIQPRHVVLYFHGGVYVMGDAALAADLASQVGRRTQAKVISVDYRLAPQHPHPAAGGDALPAHVAPLHNCIYPSHIPFAGQSA